MPSYFFSQWEICSTLAVWFSVSMAFSTGMTCIPMPAPPGGTMGVIFSRGRKVIRSKKAATSGCSSICSMRMLKNSALPGTNWGRIQRFSCLGFFPSRFSQLYSSRPMRLMSASSFSSFSVSRPVSFWSWTKVLGFRTPIFRATSAISSVTSPARPQYSGSFPVTPPSLAGTRSVIIRPSLTIFSRGWSVRGILKESLLSSRGMLDLVCFPMFVFPPLFHAYAHFSLLCSALVSRPSRPRRGKRGDRFSLAISFIL